MIRKLLSAINRLTDAVENLTEAVNALVVVMARVRQDEKRGIRDHEADAETE